MSPTKPRIYTFCRKSLPALNQIDLAMEALPSPTAGRWPWVCYLSSIKPSCPTCTVEAVTLCPRAVKIQSAIICTMPSAQSPQAPTRGCGNGGVWQCVVGK